MLSGLFAATNTTIREGRAALPDFVFGVMADGGVLFDSEERGKLCQKINPFFFGPGATHQNQVLDRTPHTDHSNFVCLIGARHRSAPRLARGIYEYEND